MPGFGDRLLLMRCGSRMRTMVSVVDRAKDDVGVGSPVGEKVAAE